ncbi:MAG: hypothetical protein ACO331_09905 [Prochlorothrix sp.]
MAIFPPSPPSTLHPWLLAWAQREWGQLQGAELQVLLALTQSESVGHADLGTLEKGDRQIRSQFIQWLLQILTIGCKEAYFDDFVDHNPGSYPPIDRPIDRSINPPIDRPVTLELIYEVNLKRAESTVVKGL